MIQRGTDASGPFEYTRRAQRWGGALSVRANYDRTAITFSGVPESLGEMIDAAASMALKATLKEKEIDGELGTLTQEIRTYYDLPSSVALFETMRAAFPKHPYRVPTLGNFRSVGTLKSEPLTAFYRNLYVPNNMTVAIAGDFDPRAAAARIETAFGPASKSATLPPRPGPPSGFAGHTDVEKKLDFKESWTSLAFMGPGYRHPDRVAFEALAAALAEPSSPVALASARGQTGPAQTSFYGLEDAGLLYIAMNPATPQLSYAAATSALSGLVAFRSAGFNDTQTRDLKDRLLRDERQRAQSVTERAERLGEAALFGGVRYYWDRPLLLSRLTAADLNRVAAKYLVPDNCRLVILVPKEAADFPEEPKAEFHKVFATLPAPDPPTPAGLDATLYSPSEGTKGDPAAWGKGGGTGALGAPRRTVLKNGLTLLVLEDHRMPLAALSVHLKGGSGSDEPGKEGRASLLLRLLGTRTAQALREGTAATPARRFPLFPEAQAGRDLLELRLSVDPSDLPLGLEAVSKSLREGAATADLERVRQAALQTLARSEGRADMVGLDLFHEKVYAGHPYAQRPDGTVAGLQAIGAADVQALAATLLDPALTVLAVAGDVDAAEVGRTVERLFGPWKTHGKEKREKSDSHATPKSPAAAAAVPGASPGEASPAPVFAATAGAQAGEFARQAHVPQSLAIVGVPGVPLLDGDFEALRYLGAAVTLFGFEEMVFERRAAFSVSGSPEGLKDGGALAFEAAAAHVRREEAQFELLRLMRRLAVEDLGDGDRRDLSRIQAGRAAASAQGAQALASLLAYREAAGLGAAGWRTDLATSTPPAAARLRALAERLFQPERTIRVVIGPPSP